MSRLKKNHNASPRTARKVWLLLVACAAVMCAPLANAAAPSEYELKAAFLLNFVRFVEWPDAALPPIEKPLVIGICGDDPFGLAIDRIVSGETVKGRALTVRRYRRNEPIDNGQILFISRSEMSALPALLKTLKGDADRFAFEGGMIGFAIEQGKVRVHINPENARGAQLKISAKLLQVSVVVHNQTQFPFPPAGSELFCATETTGNRPTSAHASSPQTRNDGPWFQFPIQGRSKQIWGDQL